ncbi:MAG: hypothetical protein GX945_07430 [Lentisphaerae bacterium]|nr:hypothetical protein [Lentisphaerota bacterium]
MDNMDGMDGMDGGQQELSSIVSIMSIVLQVAGCHGHLALQPAVRPGEGRLVLRA